MNFQSAEFLLLLTAVFTLYWALHRFSFRWQNIVLVAASYVFYGYVHPWLLILLASYTAIAFAAAIGIERSPHRKRVILTVVLMFALGGLGVFKYFNFFAQNFADVASLVGIRDAEWSLKIFLPLGISFYAFEVLSYVFDVYRGRQRATRNLLDFALFVSFFPHLVAGPIQRAGNLLTQIEKKRVADPEQMRAGLVLIAWGFFKKLVIADNVAAIANQMFALEHPTFGLAWVGVLAFGIQILADFSGYIDIARGIAALLGFRLSQNFIHPYLSLSPADFWRRWNMTLSFWFRDYVYIPLGGSRKGRLRTFLNLMVTFFVTGLWHGAAWNFVVWGLYHGLLVSATNLLGPRLAAGRERSRVARAAAIFGTFVLMMAGWLFFRESSFARIFQVLRLSPFAMTAEDARLSVYLLGQVAFFSLPLWLHAAYDALSSRGWVVWAGSPRLRTAVEAAAAGVFCLGAIGFQAPDPTQFIYFQF